MESTCSHLSRPETQAPTSRPPLVNDDRFRAMANAAPVMIWMSGPDALCTFFNQQWLDFTGRAMQHELGNGWAENVHADDLARCLGVYTQSFERRVRFEMEYRLQRADGKYRWVFDIGVPMVTAAGDFSGYIGSCVDITDRKLAEEALRESEDRYRDLVENSGILFGTHDLEGRVLSVNQAAVKLSECTRSGELIGRRIDEFLSPEVRHLYGGYLQTVISLGHAQGLMKIRTETGGERILEYNNSLRREGLDRPVVRCIAHDVTEKTSAERALRVSEERYRLVAENSRDLIKLLDADGKILYASPSHRAVLGCAPEDLAGRCISGIVHPDDQVYLRSALREIVESRGTKTVEFRVQGKAGINLQVEAILSAIPDESGSVRRILLTGRDITRRRRAEQVSRSQTAVLIRTLNLLAADPALETFLDHVLRAITEQLQVFSCALYLQNPDNPAVPIEMTYEDGQSGARSTPIRPIGPSSDSPWDQDPAFVLVDHARGPVVVEDVPNSPAFSKELRAWAEASGIQTILLVPLLQGEKILGTLSIRSREKRRYGPEEREVAQALAHQATLAVQLTRLAEEGQRSVLLHERNRMAQEMHDTLAQGFTGIVVQLEAADDALAESGEAARKHISRARQLARESLAEARRSVWALRPQVLEHSNLPNAVKSLVEQLTHGASLDAKFKVQGTPQPLPSEVESNLLRISQEALANSLRHAAARSLEVAIIFTGRQIQMRVRDDGAGFDPHLASGSARGLGLTSMQARAQSMGGKLRIKSQPGRGTLIQVTVPLSGLQD